MWLPPSALPGRGGEQHSVLLQIASGAPASSCWTRSPTRWMPWMSWSKNTEIATFGCGLRGPRAANGVSAIPAALHGPSSPSARGGRPRCI